jgi:DNA-binding FrmR family transcriptional regulator
VIVMSAARRPRGVGKARGISKKPGTAARRAEIPGAAVVLGPMRRPGGVDGHAANRIDSGNNRPDGPGRFNRLVHYALPAVSVTLPNKPLAVYTVGGYSVKAMKPKTQASCRSRLRRIEGQVRGIERMIDEERYCIDILTQLQAVRAALKKVEDEVLKDHVEHCVHDAIRSGKTDEQFEKIDELLRVLEKRTT